MYRFKCDGQELRCIVHDTAASGYIDTVNAAFDLCKRWDGMDVTVQYTQTQGGAERTFNEHLDSETGIARVSNSLIDGPVKVSIFGYIRETGARLTSEPCEIHINKSGYKENGEPPLPPEPDLYVHLLQEVDEIVKKGISDRQVADAVNAHLAEHPPKVETDTTLAIPGDAADAAAVGEALDTLEKEKLSASALPTAIDDALAKAKASGEFDGEDGKPGADGAPGKDGYTPTLALERVEDGVKVKATNADGEQVETVYDGTRDVFVVRISTVNGGNVADRSASEIREAAKSGKACVAVARDGMAYVLQCDENTFPTKSIPTFVGAPVDDGYTNMWQTHIEVHEDKTAVSRLVPFTAASPGMLTISGAVEAAYDGSEPVKVSIPDNLFVFDFASGAACKTSQEDVRAAVSAKKACFAISSDNSVFTYLGEQPDKSDTNVNAPTFVCYGRYGSNKLNYKEMQIQKNGVSQVYGFYDAGVSNPNPLTINGTSYDGSKPVNLTIEGGDGGGSSLPEPAGAHQMLVTDSDGNWTQEERLAYSTTETVEVLKETAVTFDTETGEGYLTEPSNGTLEAGKTYIVTWNGAQYECVSFELPFDENFSVACVGNAAVEGANDTGEPFLALLLPPETAAEMGAYGAVKALDGSTSATIKIVGEHEVVKGVDRKYLGNLRGQRIITITESEGDVYSSDTSFDVAWSMDVAELQACMRYVNNNGRILSVTNVEKEDGSDNARPYRRIFFTIYPDYSDSYRDSINPGFVFAWISTQFGSAIGLIRRSDSLPNRQSADDEAIFAVNVLESATDNWIPAGVSEVKTILGVDKVEESVKTLSEEKADKEEPYELIETIVCDGTYGNISRKNVAFKRVKLFIHTTGAETAASVGIETNNSYGLFGYAWIPNLVNTAERWSYAEAVSNGHDDAYIEYSGAATSSYGTGNINKTATKIPGDTPINRIGIYVSGSANFPEGTTVEIWGVRA